MQLVHFYIPQYRVRLAKRYAKENGQSLSDYIRQALNKQINNDINNKIVASSNRKEEKNHGK